MLVALTIAPVKGADDREAEEEARAAKIAEIDGKTLPEVTADFEAEDTRLADKWQTTVGELDGAARKAAVRQFRVENEEALALQEVRSERLEKAEMEQAILDDPLLAEGLRKQAEKVEALREKLRQKRLKRQQEREARRAAAQANEGE
jgi:PP-loop superfamily ATP-utilizing enzyme